MEDSFIAYCDASKKGFRRCLMQRDKGGFLMHHAVENVTRRTIRPHDLEIEHSVSLSQDLETLASKGRWLECSMITIVRISLSPGNTNVVAMLKQEGERSTIKVRALVMNYWLWIFQNILECTELKHGNQEHQE
ncbi:hypothetical protein Tco_0874296 [Tanacetum coccineum]|uniref:Uncharacterized protein n=1 Tax=Tanacetum coccineum TaxID=301880 RepID=A0ABQ5BL85_9ASTR